MCGFPKDLKLKRVNFCLIVSSYNIVIQITKNNTKSFQCGSRSNCTFVNANKEAILMSTNNLQLLCKKEANNE